MSEFTVLENGIDDIEIIRHDKTGYYNITKINMIIKSNRDFKSSKKIGHWFESKNNKELLDIMQTELDNDKLYYEMKDVENKYRGTYVHELLYDIILMWLDNKYAIRVAHILRDIHLANNVDLVNKNLDLTQKLDKIIIKMDKSSRENCEQKLEMNDQKLQIKALIEHNKAMEKKHNIKFDEIIGYSKNLQETAENMQDDLNTMQNSANDMRNDFVNVLPRVNTDPADARLIQSFALVQSTDKPNELRFLTGQSKTVIKNMKGMTILIDKQSNPNPTAIC
jgi:KilA-N domain